MPESPSHPEIDLGRLSPGLGDTCGEYLECYRGDLEDAVRRGEGGVAVARRYAKSLDGLLSALFCASNAASRGRAGEPPVGRVALVAVGGYGRELVALHSDVDVLFLCDDPSDPHVSSVAEGLLYPLWDLGLSIGHAVRGVEETLRLARDDIRTATTLLDLRRVAGDATIVDDLVRAGRRQVFEPALDEFLDALAKDTEERHERYGGSLFLLEPEVKLGRGGLRDLDVAEWAARARWGSRSKEDFVRTGALLSREAEELDHAREMLWRVRNLLHLRAGRRQDRLTFADQEDIAEELGFVDGVTLAVEQFMQAYYRHARVVAQTAERMLARARPSRRSGRAQSESLGDGTMIFDGHLTFESSERLAEDPALALRLYRKVQKKGLPPYPYARDAVARVAVDPEWREKLQGSEEAVQLFLGLLTRAAKAPVRRGSVLGELHEVGLMLAMIPEFEPVTGRVQHDVYHVYTVDVHSVAAVDYLKSLVRGDRKAELPLACRLAAEQPRPTPLFLALLLHDIGKAYGKDHSRRGAIMAREIATRLGLSAVDVEHVVWLVQEHLSLYKWATRRDTSDPETVSEIAKQAGTYERLRDLYLLTVADLSTTNPGAMTSWKARMLEDLYLAVAGVLEGGTVGSVQTRASEIRDEARVGFVGDRGQKELEAFVRDMPDRYLLANPVDVIRYHARAARDRNGRLVHVALAPGPSEDLSEVVIVTDDRPGLLADVTAVLAANRLSVVTAQIHTRPRETAVSEAFDIFDVRREGRDGDPVDARLLARIEADLADMLEGRVTADALLARVPRTPSWAQRHTPDVPTEVIVDNAVSRKFTVVDVFTRDRVGLLHVIAKTLHDEGLSIALSKISTEGEKAADVFYVQDASGGKLRDPKRLDTLAATLRATLDRFHAQEGGAEAQA